MTTPSTPSREEIAGQLRTMQIICGSLIAGVTIFLFMTFVVRSGEDAIIVQDRLDLSSVLVLIALLAAGLSLLMYYTLPTLVIAGQRQALASGQTDLVSKKLDRSTNETVALAAIYQTQMIIGLALLEGAAFLNTIVFMLEGRALNLGIAVALVVFMATRFPTRTRLDDWIAEQGRLLQDEASTT